MAGRRSSRWKSALLALANRRGVDWIVALVVALVGAHVLVSTLRCVDQVSLRSAEVGLAGICGTIAGFLAASLVFSAGVDNRVMKRVRRKFGSDLSATLLGGTATLFVSALACLGASLAPSSGVSVAVVLGVLALVALKLARVMVLLSGVLATVNDSASDAS
jgi:hypothetical protein